MASNDIAVEQKTPVEQLNRYSRVGLEEFVDTDLHGYPLMRAHVELLRQLADLDDLRVRGDMPTTHRDRFPRLVNTMEMYAGSRIGQPAASFKLTLSRERSYYAQNVSNWPERSEAKSLLHGHLLIAYTPFRDVLYHGWNGDHRTSADIDVVTAEDVRRNLNPGLGQPSHDRFGFSEVRFPHPLRIIPDSSGYQDLVSDLIGTYGKLTIAAYKKHAIGGAPDFVMGLAEPPQSL